jgi:DNA-binding IclR family transcriptional regulator
LILDKLAMGRIMGYARPQPVAASEIATGLDLPATEVARHLNVLAQRGMVKLDGNQVRVAAAVAA